MIISKKCESYIIIWNRIWHNFMLTFKQQIANWTIRIRSRKDYLWSYGYMQICREESDRSSASRFPSQEQKQWATINKSYFIAMLIIWTRANIWVGMLHMHKHYFVSVNYNLSIVNVNLYTETNWYYQDVEPKSNNSRQE